MNRLHIAMMAGLTGGFVVCFLFLKFVFNLVPLNFLGSLVLGVFALLAWPVMNVMDHALTAVQTVLKGAKEKLSLLRAGE